MNTALSLKPASGILYALAAAILFGASTPFAKLLLNGVGPILLAGLLYLGSGIGLSVWLLVRSRVRGSDATEAPLKCADAPWLAGSIVFGGVLGPMLLMVGLATTPAADASLLLNLEGVFTALLAWFVFRENFDRRIAIGMACITAGGVVLSWAGSPTGEPAWGTLAITGACLAWGIDNNLTRNVSAGDPVQIAAIKGLVAGVVNSAIGLSVGGAIPDGATIAVAGIVGLLGYGVSLTCFVLALRYLGTARTGAYFSLAPFVGAVLSLFVFRQWLTFELLLAALLMGVGLWLHLTERHEHEHHHEPQSHEHAHSHDEHHQHTHGPDDPPGEPHSHAHDHSAQQHSHAHYPDIHHRHEHGT